MVPNLFGTRDQFHGRQFFHEQEQWVMVGCWAEGFGMIQARYIYLHFISIIITLAPPQIIRH